MQHAPMRRDYDGFPGYPIHPIEQQIQAVELLSGRPVVAVTLNHEAIEPRQVPEVCAELGGRLGLPVVDVLLQGAEPLVAALAERLPATGGDRG